MVTARTNRTTLHGNPGQSLVLPVGTLVEIRCASNLPLQESGIARFWVNPVNPGDVNPEMLAWANGPGILLDKSDLGEFRERRESP